MKYLILVLSLFMIYLNNLYSQETKISLNKIFSETDTQSIYTFVVNPFKGDSVYIFEVYLIDSLSQNSILISTATIPVNIRRIEKEIFFHDKFGNKLATFKFEYIIKNNGEYFDNYFKIPANINSKTLEGKITLKLEKKYKLIFNNLHGVIKDFDLIE